MAPRKSSRVSIFTAAFVERKCAQGNTERHRSIVVESVGGLLQIDTERLLRIKTTRSTNQRLRKVGVNAPVADFVGIGQRAARDPALDAHVIELVCLRT